MIELKERPKNPTIIEGFPGFGFVSTIATEFLIKHLNAKKIGKFSISNLAPMVVIHNSEIVNPLEIFYDKKSNIIILRALGNVAGAEWEIASEISKLAKDLKAKEIVSIEGVSSTKTLEKKDSEVAKVYFYTNQKKKMGKMDVQNLENGIVMGVTGVLLLDSDNFPMSCIFAEADPNLPDSRAAGEVIKVLDKYLGLKIDYRPLIKTAEEVEGKLKDLITKIKTSSEQKDKKENSYYG